MLLQKFQLHIIPWCLLSDLVSAEWKLASMTWIASLFPTSCVQLCFRQCTLKLRNCVHENGSGIKKECSHYFSPCFFWPLSIFISRMQVECLARKGEEKHSQAQVTQPRDSTSQLHWIPEPTHLSLVARGHWGLVWPACPLLQCHTVIFPGREGTWAFVETSPCGCPDAALAGCTTKVISLEWHYWIKGAKSSHLIDKNHQNSILSTLYSFPPTYYNDFFEG